MADRYIPSVEFILVSSHLQDDSARFRRAQYLATFKIKHNIKSVVQLHEAYHDLTSAFVRAIQPYRNAAGPHDIFTFSLIHPTFTPDCFIAPQKKNNFNENCFVESLGKLSQSNTKFLLNGFLEIQISIVKLLTASGKHKRLSQIPQTHTQYLDSKISRYFVDHSIGCGYICLAIAKRRYEMKTETDHEAEWKRVIRTDRESSHKLRVEMGQEIASLLGKTFEEPISTEYLEDFKEKTGYAVIWIHSRSKKSL